MLHWYRALVRKKPPPLDNPRISVPTLLIWGTQDMFLGRELAQPSIDFCDDGRLIFMDATHWVQHEEPEQVNKAIEDFLVGSRKKENMVERPT